MARYRTDRELDKTQIDALNKIESVVRAYEIALPKVEVLTGEGKTASEVDSAVRINDGPALAGLEVLRK